MLPQGECDKMSLCQIIFAKHFCPKQLVQCLAKLFLLVHLWFFFIAQDIWHPCGYKTILPCYGMKLTDTARLIDRLNDSDIQTNGVQRNLTDHDRRSIINRLHAKQNLMSIKYVLSQNGIPKDICLLFHKKNTTIQQVKKCRIVKGRSCNREFVLINKIRTIQDCQAEGLSETCVTKTRNHPVQVQTVLCQSTEKLKCNGNNENQTSYNEAKTCQPNRLAICQSKPKMVTVTETQRLCGKDFQEMTYRTTKMCITYEHDTDNTLIGDWKCLDFEHLYQRCLTFHVKKQIRSEIAQGGQYSKLECTHKGNL